MKSTIRVREISRADATHESDLAAIDELLMRAYQRPSRVSRVQRYLHIADRSWGVVERDGQILSVGGYIAYPDGKFGWIGLIATDPEASGQGAARLITEWCMERLRDEGCASVLDASTSGAPVYTRMGFADFGWTRTIVTPEVLAPAHVNAVQEVNTHSLDAFTFAQLKEVAEFDTSIFGASREALLSQILSEYPKCGVVCRNNAGAVSGFAIWQEQSIGPFSAANPTAMQHTLRAVLERSGSPMRLNVPAESRFLPLLLRLGCREARALRHMHHGIGVLPGDRSLLVAQASFGEG